MAKTRTERTRWVSYLRVSTVEQAEKLRTMYRLYITGSGALKVAESLNALGFRTRKGNFSDKGAVIQTLQQSAACGVVRWGVHHRGKLQPPDKWITLPVEPIIDAKTYALVKELCEQRRPAVLPGRASAKPRVLTGLARCGLCGSSYQLETSAWWNFVLRDLDIGRTYALQLIEHVDVHRERVVITPKQPGGRKECAMLAAIA